MSDLPTKATIYEVGPREGFQFEKSFIPTERKIELVKALTETGVTISRSPPSSIPNGCRNGGRRGVVGRPAGGVGRQL